MVGIRRVQRDGPLLIIGNHPVCERPVSLALHQPRQSRNTEKIASLRPQRQARQQAGQGGTSIAHGRADLDRVCVRLESVDRGHRHLAPVAHRTDDGSPGPRSRTSTCWKVLGQADQLLGMKSAKTTQSRPILPFTTGATSTIAPRGTPYGTGDRTASANANLSLTTVMSPADLASPSGIGVGPTIT